MIGKYKIFKFLLPVYFIWMFYDYEIKVVAIFFNIKFYSLWGGKNPICERLRKKKKQREECQISLSYSLSSEQVF